jgi:NAD(P)-dependent dehydrogenase (short-subunit alcohol dehydrogenase family)
VIAFDGQVIIVTGAGQGLGQAYALELSRRGASVVVNDISGVGAPGGASADSVVREIVAAGGRATASYDSVATLDGGQAIVDCALEHFGTVDAVIHNAGVWRHKQFEDMEPDQLDPVLDVHLRGAFFVVRPAWQVMQAKRYGRVVLTSSSTGAFGRAAGTNYAAAKAAMLGLARALSIEGESAGVKVNCILPVSPGGDYSALPPHLADQLRRGGWSPDNARPELAAPMAAYLASRDCTVTGEAFSAGGGRFGRVFIGVADGWTSPAGRTPSAEDVQAHLSEIRDLGSYAIPETSFDELDVIARLRGAGQAPPD